ncbi:MAG TPA: transglycosylase family protein [Acidimicrobiales bacterium]
MTGPDVAGPARRTLRAFVLPALVLLAALPLGTAARPAGADTVTSLQAQAATVAQRLVLEQLQVDAARQQTSVATAKVAEDAQAIAQITQQLAADQQAIAHHLRIVQNQAILSYIDSGANSSSTDTALFGGGTARAQAASEYASLAVGNITAEMAQLHTAQHALQSRQAALQARQSQDRADQARQAADLGQADAAAAALRSEQAGLTGQLANAVAAQQTAQARTAATAVARTPKASTPLSSVATNTPATIPATTPPSTVSSGPTNGDPYPNLPDPALNPFLTCVIQAESGGNYGIVSPNGLYMGAFQFSQPTWDSAASAAGLGLLVGVPPNHASKPEQDTVAVALYALDGQQPWLGDRCSS